MTPPPVEQLPVTASMDVGLVVFAFLVVAVAAAVGSIVYAARCEARRQAPAPPWPFHDHTSDEVYTVDAEGEVVP